MTFLSRLFRPLMQPAAPPLDPLWRWITTTARRPEWYLAHGVADTVDGRFDMVALVTSLVMLELEARDMRRETSLLTERFVDDMDGSLRDIGIGDMVIGKHMGRVIVALGGLVMRMVVFMIVRMGMPGAGEVADIGQHGGDAAPARPRAFQFEIGKGNGPQGLLDLGPVGAGVDEGGQEHVAGQTELAVYVQVHGELLG